MYLSQVFICDMSVHLRRRNVGVAQEGLHGAQIGAIFEKIGRE